MDPQTTWQEIVDRAYRMADENSYPWRDEDTFKLVEDIVNLNEWLLKGGFPPRGATPNSIEED